MSRRALSVALGLAAVVFGPPTRVHGDLVPGRGGSCAAVWDTFGAATSSSSRASTLICADGDASCDADGEQNGVCVIQLNACVGRVTPSCPAPGTIKSPLRIRGARFEGFEPPDPGAAPTCGVAGQLDLPLVRIPRSSSKPLRKLRPSRRVKVVMKAPGFVNRLVVQCVPCSASFDVCESGCGLVIPSPLQQLILTVPSATGDRGNGSDLDLGWSGSLHDIQIPSGTTLRYCLSQCDGVTNTACVGAGSTGAGSLNGATFGPPVPIVSGGVPICLVTRFQKPMLDLDYDVATGDGSGDLDLFSDAFVSSDPTEICPRCQVLGDAGVGSVGKCSATAGNPGADCRVEGIANIAQGAGDTAYLLSSACIPPGSPPPVELDLHLPLTTGTSTRSGSRPCSDGTGIQTQDDSCGAGTCSAECTGSACIAMDGEGGCIDARGGISQLCCSDAPTTACFPTRNDGAIVRQGSPAVNGGIAVFAATFCVPSPSSSSPLVPMAGLPGPGAALLPMKVTIAVP
jgi:hypothetical protein